ncbi:serine/threonine-protein kinase polo [Periplaneta americana]|uniref:serine/threonine-protein kinase polo n=1 Tax=Periplaneta americana TaxID=6978 RepID=UPI0037E86DD8
MASREDEQSIPDLIYDGGANVTYKKGRFFGKGGFAKCYEITDTKTGNVYAGKIVSKRLMTKHNQKDKLTQEIAIHRNLNHRNVVGFHGFFEDNQNVYIVLELCRRRSMMELHKRRKALTEAEVRYYMRQIILGVIYLHQHKIIHRDLKLGNLFLNDDLEVKIGDFGLAAKIEYDGERKRTLCGTPNYIAPEILNKKGHSFEVDIWSIGCILYTLLIGKPPFETSSLKETYSRIKRCEYKIPPSSQISVPAAKMIRATLQPDPKCRPKVEDLLNNEFFTSGYIPSQLPVSCLTVAPRADKLERTVGRKPLLEVNAISETVGPVGSVGSPKKKTGSNHPSANNDQVTNIKPGSQLIDSHHHLVALRDQLRSVIKSNPTRETGVFGDEATDPAAQPIVWISKWVDYSDKYGFGYQLCDEGVGVVFNDTTKLVMLANGKNVQYITREGKEFYYLMEEYPDTLDKKMKLLSYFRRYMSEHLVKAGATVPVRECDSLSRVPYLTQWFRTSSAVVMLLTNGTLQINFMDHTKIIMCPLMAAVTYIDENKNFRTYRFSSIEKNGCNKSLASCLKYALDKINVIL